MGYEPTSKVKAALDLMRAEPERVFSSTDLARVMDVQVKQVASYMDAALRHGATYRKLGAGGMLFRGTPFPSETFTPAPMRAPRPGSEHPRVLASSPRPAPLGEPPAPAPTAPPPTIHSTEPPPALADASIPEGAGAEDHDEQEEEVEPDAFVSCRTGEIILIGCPVDDEGRVTVPADLVLLIKRQIAWSLAR